MTCPHPGATQLGSLRCGPLTPLRYAPFRARTSATTAQLRFLRPSPLTAKATSPNLQSPLSAIAYFKLSVAEVWGPPHGEATEVTIGASPVYLGGGSVDHVFVRGLPARALSVVLAGGRILCTNHTNGIENQLKDGSRIRAGVVELVVHAKTTTTK